MSVYVQLLLALLSTVNIVLGVELCDRPADIAFVIDSSRSINEEDFKSQLHFVQDLVNTFKVGPDNIHVAALTFSDNVEKEFHFNDVATAQEAADRIGKITHALGGATYTHGALESMREDLFSPSNGARADVPKVCVLLTDGQSTQRTDTLKQAKLAKDAGITIVAIGIGTGVKDEELEAVVSAPASENYVRTSSFEDLKNKLQFIGKQACEVIETTPQPMTTLPGDESKKTCQGKEVDLLFVVDMSSSIWSTHFKEQLQFLANFISFFDINSGKTRVGMVTFSNYSRIEFYLDQYTTHDELTKAILAVQQDGGLTNTHIALETVRNEMFTNKHGSRGGIAHICIVITDGVSRVPQQTIANANLVHKSGADVFAIGVGDKPDVTELGHIASKSEYVFQVDGYGALRKIEDILANKACEDITTPAPRPTPEEHKDPCRGRQKDVVFVVDMSNSIWSEDFKKQLSFLSELVSSFEVDNGNMRVGMLTWSEGAKVQFFLDAYGNKEDLKNAISAVKFGGGLRTNTHFALQAVREEMMTTEHGLRKGVDAVAVVFTDGVSREQKQTAEQAEMLHQAGVDVISVGIGDDEDIDVNELKTIASRPQYVFTTGSYDTLNQIKTMLVDKTCEVPVY